MIDILSNRSYTSGNAHPLVVAYFTANTPYEAEAETLKLSLESLGYSYLVCGVPNQGTWQKNTQLKAQFIGQMLEEMPDQPLLYLDVDAVMVQPPLLLDDLKADIAAVHFCGGKELLSGTIYLGGTGMTRLVVQNWLLINKLYPEILPNGRESWDQRTLEMAIKGTPGVQFVELPQGFTWITELTQRRMPGLAPVILHTRGAKRFRNLINHQPGYAR